VRPAGDTLLSNDATQEDLEKLCEDMDAYEKEFSNIINDEK
jgi:hypothetical protein